MKNWNRTGKIKAVILAVLCIPNLIFASPFVHYMGVVQIIMPLLFGAFALPLTIKFNSSIFASQQLEKPNWNENPLTFKRPLVFYQFGGWFMISIGTSMIVGTAVIHHVFHTFGLTAIMFGIGILLGIELALRWFK